LWLEDYHRPRVPPFVRPVKCAPLSAWEHKP
jgi:hypothetical protein